MKQQAISIVLADNSVLFKDGFRAFIETDDRYLMKGFASNGDDLIELVKTTEPDIVFTEVDLPQRDGVGATQYITVNHPATVVIALSSTLTVYHIRNMLRAGAISYLHKSATKQEILACLAAANNNRTFFCSTTQELLTRYYSSTGLKNIVDGLVLTETEQFILQLICDELSTDEIAEKMNMQKRTVDGYRQRIAHKTGAKNIAGLLKYAVREGVYRV